MPTATHKIIHGTTDCTPEEAGIDSGRLDALDRFFMEQIEKNKLIGVNYLIARKAKIAAHRAMGRMNGREQSGEMRPDAVGELFDVTMIFTAAAVLQLADRGMLSTDRPAADWLQPFDHPYYRGITIEHLLEHKSGLPAMGYVYGSVYEKPNFDWHPEFRRNWLEAILAGPLHAEPGKLRAFSTAGYAVLGRIVELASGMKFEAYVESNLLRPLGMTDTFFNVPPERRGDIAYGMGWQEWGINEPADSRTPRSFKGLYASVTDLLKFGEMLRGGGERNGTRVLSPEAAGRMTSCGASMPELAGGVVREGTRWTAGLSMIGERHLEPSGREAFFFPTAQAGLFVDPEAELVYAYHTPNDSWDFETAYAMPKQIMLSAVLPPDPDRGIGVPAASSAASSAAEALEDLDEYFRNETAEGRIQGATYVVARSGCETASFACGRRRADDPHTPLDADTLLRFTSVTKLVTMTAVMQLAEDGLLDLAQPVRHWLPEFDTPIHRDIALLHLLDHSSGIAPEPGLCGEPYPSGWWEYRFLHHTGEDGKAGWIKAVLAGPLAGKPGTGRWYSTAGYLLLGEIVQRVAGMPFESFAAERIFRPLGMTSAAFAVPPERQAAAAAADEWQEFVLMRNAGAAAEPPRSGTGLYATASDMAKFGRMLLGRGTADGVRVVGSKYVELLETFDYMDTPGVVLAGRKDGPFTLGIDRYPVRQLDFPVPDYHESSLTGALLLDRRRDAVAVLHVPVPANRLPESLVQGAERLAAAL